MLAITLLVYYVLYADLNPSVKFYWLICNKDLDGSIINWFTWCLIDLTFVYSVLTWPLSYCCTNMFKQSLMVVEESIVSSKGGCH